MDMEKYHIHNYILSTYLAPPAGDKLVFKYFCASVFSFAIAVLYDSFATRYESLSCTYSELPNPFPSSIRTSWSFTSFIISTGIIWIPYPCSLSVPYNTLQSTFFPLASVYTTNVPSFKSKPSLTLTSNVDGEVVL